MGSLRTLKNRGLASHIGAHLHDMKLSETFTSIDVRPYIIDAFPHASNVAVTSALETLRNHGVLTRVARGAYRRVAVTAPNGQQSTDAIDQALTALALVETVLREWKTKIEKLDELRALLK